MFFDMQTRSRKWCVVLSVLFWFDVSPPLLSLTHPFPRHPRRRRREREEEEEKEEQEEEEGEERWAEGRREGEGEAWEKGEVVGGGR